VPLGLLTSVIAAGKSLPLLLWARENGRYWGELTCAAAQKQGGWMCFSGHMRTAALGMN
jgi:hypothetical protein